MVRSPSVSTNDFVIRLFERRNTGLNPGENEITDSGEDSGQQSHQRSETEGENFEPEFRTQLSWPCVRDVTKDCVAMHLRVDLDDDSS